MENKNTQIEVIPSNETALYLITKAEVDTAIATANAFPRDLEKFRKDLLKMSTLSEGIAESCNYGVPRQGKDDKTGEYVTKIISGPSVRFAEMACASYKNIRSGARVIANDGKTITAQGICHDLESNNSVTVEVKKKITTKKGITFSEDMQTVTGNAACAIAYRNAVFKVIPAALTEDIFEQTKVVAKGTAATLETRRNNAIAYFKTLDVTEAQILAVLGVKTIKEITLDKLAELVAIRSAIRDGETTAKDAFNPKKEESQSPDKVAERIIFMLDSAISRAELEMLESECTTPELKAKYKERWEILL